MRLDNIKTITMFCDIIFFMDNMLRKNEIYEAAIDGYTAEGLGVARINGMAVFVPASARGDRLRIKIVKLAKNHAYGIIDAVLEPSPHRIAPACPAFPVCGGCDFLHISYEEELRLKGKRVEDALRRIGGFDISVAPAAPSFRRGYRNKAQFPLAMASGRAAFGFYRRRSHDVVPVGRCLIQGARANALAAAVCRWIDESGAEVYDETDHAGLVRRIYVREGAHGCLLCLVINGGAVPQGELLIELARAAAPDLRGIVLNINRERTNRVLGQKSLTLWGEDGLTDSLSGITFDLAPEAFYQINHTQAEALYARAIELAELTPGDTALDLYCGVGTITLLLARSCGEAIGCEIVPEAVENARENARRNAIGNARFILGDAGEAASALAREGLRPRVIVCDPPRKGMDEQTVEAIAAMAPERVVYISCDPASLARDCARLAARGYALKSADAFDMFPATANVETVCCLYHQKKDFISVPCEPKSNDCLKQSN